MRRRTGSFSFSLKKKNERESSFPLLSSCLLTCCDETRGAEEREIRGVDQFPKSFPNLFSPKSPAIREVLQRRMMGNYTGLEICFANLASPPSSSFFFILGLQSQSFSLFSLFIFHKSLPPSPSLSGPA